MNNELRIQLGKKIRELRKNKGLSQEQLAERLDIAINTLSNIERGNSFMTSSTLEKISKIFEVSYSELFNFIENKDSKYLYDLILTRLNLIRDNYEKLSILDKFTEILI